MKQAIWYIFAWLCTVGHRIYAFRIKDSISSSRYSLRKFFEMSSRSSKEYTSVLIVPTGIGASIGGYAGFSSFFLRYSI